MGDQWETRIGAIENIQEEFGHNIREIKERLAKLITLLEDHIRTEVVHLRGPSPLLNRQVPRQFIQTTSYLPCETDRPSLRQLTPTTPPAFRATSRIVDQSSGSKGKPSGQKINKDKP